MDTTTTLVVMMGSEANYLAVTLLLLIGAAFVGGFALSVGFITGRRGAWPE